MFFNNFRPVMILGQSVEYNSFEKFKFVIFMVICNVEIDNLK